MRQLSGDYAPAARAASAVRSRLVSRLLRTGAGPGMLVALAFHLPLVLSQQYRLSYDAYLHLFFADHYRRDWWQLWEPRWYTGFSVASYPPLLHQALALVSWVVGLEAAFGVMLLIVMALLPLAVYRFACVFVPPRAARVAALMAGLVPAVSLVSYTFGQLAALAGTALLLWVLAQLCDYLRDGRGLGLLVLWLAVLAALHHVTPALFLPFGAAAIGLRVLLEKPQSWPAVLRRAATVAVLGTAAMLAVIFPFVEWYQGFTLQTPIDHGSRHNFLTSAGARDLFLWPLYGPLLLLPFYALWRWRRCETLPLLLFTLALITLGLGGTTPVPRWLYGPGWEWLTYDRFSILAALVMLPYVGLLWIEVSEHLSRLPARAAAAMVVLALGASSLYAAALPNSLPTQPQQIDLGPAVAFVERDDHSQWRYLTLGLGDQMNQLAYLTTAASVDGSYHTARKLPELTGSGVGQLDGALWWDPSGEVLAPFLDHPERFALRWALNNDDRYTELLVQHGWMLTATLDNGLGVWTPPWVPPPIAAVDPPHPVAPGLYAVAWGVLPLLTLTLAVIGAVYQRLHPLSVPIGATGPEAVPVGSGDGTT